MNNSTDAVDLPVSEEIPFVVRTIVCTIILSFAVFGNCLVIFSLLRVKKLRKVVSNMFILNLAFCDIVSVMVNIPWDLASVWNGYFPFGSFGCKVVPPLGTFAVNSSVLTLLVISIERYGYIVHPIRFRMRKRTAYISIACVHVTSLISVSPYISTLKLNTTAAPSCEETWSANAGRIYTVFLFLLQYAVPLPFIICLYFIAWMYIRHSNSKTIKVMEKTHRDRLASYFQQELLQTQIDIEQNKTNKRNLKKRLRSTRTESKLKSHVSVVRQRQTYRTLLMFICVISVFAICMFPNQITWFYLSFKDDSLSNVIITIFLWLTYSNSVLNPWIYGGFNPHFRRAYRKAMSKLVDKVAGAICPNSIQKVEYKAARAGSNNDYSSIFEGNSPFPQRADRSSTIQTTETDFHVNLNDERYRSVSDQSRSVTNGFVKFEKIDEDSELSESETERESFRRKEKRSRSPVQRKISKSRFGSGHGLKDRIISTVGLRKTSSNSMFQSAALAPGLLVSTMCQTNTQHSPQKVVRRSSDSSVRVVQAKKLRRRASTNSEPNLNKPSEQPIVWSLYIDSRFLSAVASLPETDL